MTNTQIITTKVLGLTIEHPHSGEVSRSRVETLLIHEGNGYLGETRPEKLNIAVENLKRYNISGIIQLVDENGKIRIGRTM